MDITFEIKKIQESRRELIELLDTLPETLVEIPAQVGDWSIKDALGHITAWEEVSLIPLSGFIHARPWIVSEIPDHDAWNAVQVEKRRSMSLQEVVNEMDQVRRELLAAVDDFPPERLDEELIMPWGETTTLAGMISGLAWHEQEHTKEIRKAIRHA
jgi:uncharacterized damage-inducible protein DinB